jgi:hypothetical protein
MKIMVIIASVHVWASLIRALVLDPGQLFIAP